MSTKFATTAGSVLLASLVVALIAADQPKEALPAGAISRLPTIEKTSVKSLAYLPDGKTLVTVGDDKIIRAWDTVSSKQLRSAEAAGSIQSVSKDGKTLLTLDDRVLHIWNTAELKEVGKLKVSSFGLDPEYFDISPDGKTLAVAGFGYVQILNLATGKNMSAKWRSNLDLGGKAALRAAFVGADGMLAVSAYFYAGGPGIIQNYLYLIDYRKDKVLARIPFPTLDDAGQCICRIKAMANGRAVAVVSGNGIRITETSTGKERGKTENLPMVEWSGHCPLEEFSANGRYFAYVLGRAPNCFHLLDVMTGREIKKIEGHRGWLSSLAFSPNGKAIATADHDGEVLIWDLAELRRSKK